VTFQTPSGRRIPLAPPEGWLTLGLVLLLCVSLAWSLDDGLLVLGKGELTDFLVWAAVGGVFAGLVGPLVGWGRWRTYAIGAVVAALAVPLLVGWVLIPEGAALGVLFRGAAESAVNAWRDLMWLNNLSTREYGHHLLLLGLIVWASSLFASYAAFGHRRPVNGVLLIGFLLIANMSLTIRDQMIYLILYSLAGLFLLIRFHTFDEQSDWVRRRIGDPTALSGLYLRGGTIFIVTAVIGSLLLTTVAASKPLAGVWTDMGGRVIEWSAFLEKYLPVSGSGRSIGPSFGSSASISGVWTTNNDPALTWRTTTPMERPPYLAAVFYDDFRLDGWRISGEPSRIERAPGQDLLGGTLDAVDPAGRQEYSITVDPVLTRGVIWAPETALRINGDSTVRFIGDGGYLAQLERSVTGDPYTVTSLIAADEKDGGPTQSKLRAAGRDYPPGMLDLYGQAAVPPGTFTTRQALDLLDEIRAEADDDPFDIAAQIVTTLRDPNRFTYSTDVRDVRCQEASIVDCFAVYQRGYCEYYATAMAMMLRALDIPARLVEGFLPGAKDPATGEWLVRNSDSHAWVQVYFPGYGWVDFDPTGGRQGAELAPLPSGIPEAIPSAGASASRGPRPDPTIRDIDEPSGSVASTGSPGGPAGPFIVVGLLLAIVIGVLAAVAFRRGPRGPVSADGAYGTVTRFATRLGFAPRPEQTVYEYAGVLAELLPESRPELELVARAKVEVAYGGRSLGQDRLGALREAQRRLRVSLLRLVFRRDRRKRR
jgi:Transglutaminase-like superfamily/Domain of unknown function (DUF4129)